MVKVILSTSVVFLVIVVIRWLFRGKVGNVFLYTIWLLFAAGLMAPGVLLAFQGITGWEKSGVKSPVSIMNLVEMPSGTDDKASGNVQKKKEDTEEEGEKQKEENVGKNTEKDSKRVQEGGKSEGFFWLGRLQLKPVLLFFWAIGAVGILLRQILMEKAFRRLLAENREETDYQGHKVYRTKGIKTPLLFRSRGVSADIYLPETIMGYDIFVRHAVLHESIHKKHGDIWWGYLRNLLVAIYWFYPLVWIAAVLSKRDCEYACDSSVMKGMDKRERISYGNSLLSLIQTEKGGDLFCTATAMKIKKSEMEVRIQMIKRGKKRSIFVTIFSLLLLCIVGIAAFTEAMEPEMGKEGAEPKKLASPVRRKKEETFSVKTAEYELSDLWGADLPKIYFEDRDRMIFGGYFGLFVYSKQNEKIEQSVNLKEIGCDATQGDRYCKIDVSEDGKTVYLHVVHEKEMYQYMVDTQKLKKVAYHLPKNLYNREKWGKTNKSGIRCNGGTIGDLVYWCEGKGTINYYPLFYKPYGACDFFKPDDFRDLCEVSFYNNGTEYIITEAEKLDWIEKHFSNPVQEIKGAPACPFYYIMYFKRKDGACGKVFPATDSDSVYQSGESYYEYKKDGKEGYNEVFWGLFGIHNLEELR